MATPQTSIGDYQAYLTASGNYQDVADMIKQIAGNLDSTVAGSVSGWQGSAQVAFAKFSADLDHDIQTLYGNLTATVDALKQGQAATENTDYENASAFTNLGSVNIAPGT